MHALGVIGKAMSGMTSKGSSRSRPFLYGLLGCAAVLAILLPLGSFRMQSAGRGAAASFPVRIMYELDYQDGGGPGLAHASYTLDVESWASWRQVQTCCHEYAGYIQEWHEGTMRSGYADWDSGLLVTHQGDREALAVPGPDFSQARPMTPHEVAATGGLTLEPALASEHAARMGLPSNWVVAYSSKLELNTDGTPLAAPGTSADALVDTEYVFHDVLRIPLYLGEWTNGELTRSLIVTSIEPGR
jgi:hypothetical protein